MSDKKILYGITGIFETPDSIISATKKTSEKYEKYDVHTPYPVHGMFGAMKLKPSLLGYVALVLGLTGAAIALLFMFWSMSIAYPNNIGGKPLFPLPAFIPVTFEVTVLLASVGTVVAMLAIFFKFPNNSHPLHDTPYMKKVSSDKFGVCIEADDKNFNEAEVRSYFESIGAVDIESIYYDMEELSIKNQIFDKKFIIGLVSIAVVFSGLIYFLLNHLMFMNPFNWMSYQQKVSAQETSEFFRDGFSMRVPVQGTVARGFKPYPYKGQPELAAEFMVNPLIATESVLERGQRNYDVFCSPCHDYHGTGVARLNGQFPNPPSLHSDKVVNWTDGSIYHVISEGQNSMPSYSKHLTSEEKWEVILYVRALQRAFNAKEEDLQ